MLSRVFTRGFSGKHAAIPSSVASNRAPTISENVPGRYAEVLFSQASKAKVLDVVHRDFEHISQLLAKSSQFKAFVSNTSTNRNEQREVLSTIKPAIGSLTSNFLGLLMRALG